MLWTRMSHHGRAVSDANPLKVRQLLLYLPQPCTRQTCRNGTQPPVHLMTDTSIGKIGIGQCRQNRPSPNPPVRRHDLAAQTIRMIDLKAAEKTVSSKTVKSPADVP